MFYSLLCSCTFIVIKGLSCSVSFGGAVFIYIVEAAVLLYIQSSLLFTLPKYSSVQ
jgi:hypothetical protein